MAGYDDHPMEDITSSRGQTCAPRPFNASIPGHSNPYLEYRRDVGRHNAAGEGIAHGRHSATSHYQALLSSPATHPEQSHFSMSSEWGKIPEVSATTAAWNGSSTCPKERGACFHWTLESVLAVTLVALLVAICFTLVSRREQPLPQWPLKITLNTLLSVYSVVLKTAILYIVTTGLGQIKWLWYTKARPLFHFEIFDAASRGPWGSLQMLWSLHFRSIAASLGALIVIISLAVDPFVQQIVQVYPCSITNQTSKANIPRTNYFDDLGGHIAAGVSGISPGMQGFVNAGMFAPSSISIPFNCPTGNCTFSDLYHTVGLCSSCTDVTSDLILTCGTMDQNVSYPGIVSDQNCSYALPSKYDGQAALELANVSASISSGISLITSRVDSSGFAQLIWNFANVQAAQCTFDSCIKSINGTVTAGNLTESVVTKTKFEGSMDGTMIRLDCLSDSQKGVLKQQGYTIESGADWLPYNGTNLTYFAYTPPDGLILQPDNAVPAQCMYSINAVSTNSILYFLAGYLSGTLSTKGTDLVSLQDQPIGPAQLGAIYNYGQATFDSVAANFEDVTNAITAHIRQNGNVNFSSFAIGTIQIEQTCTHIRWEWLSLPAALVLATIIFLLMTIFAASKQQIGQNWKLSQYPLFFHGLDQETLNRTQNLDRLKDMEKSGKTMHVQLVEREHGLKLAEIR